MKIVEVNIGNINFSSLLWIQLTLQYLFTSVVMKAFTRTYFLPMIMIFKILAFSDILVAARACRPSVQLKYRTPCWSATYWNWRKALWSLWWVVTELIHWPITWFLALAQFTHIGIIYTHWHNLHTFVFFRSGMWPVWCLYKETSRPTR